MSEIAWLDHGTGSIDHFAEALARLAFEFLWSLTTVQWIHFVMQGFTILVKKLFVAKNPLEIVSGVYPTDMGSYDSCRGIADGHYQFCDMYWKDRAYSLVR